MRRGRRGMSSFRAGLIALIVTAIAVYAGFARDNPFADGYQLKAVFESANNIGLRSPVRIAGVDVGKVTKVERRPGTSLAVVTMELNDDALPIHRDAELKIRPRIFLEGNFFVDVRPGTPRAPEMRSGETVPVTQTATPVQLDQILTALQSDTRSDLQELLEGFGDALAGPPVRGEDRDQDRATRGETGGEALNDSLRDSPAALRGTALVSEAQLGTELHDLSRLIAGQRRVSAALARDELQLKDLVTNFNRTVAAFGSEESSLRRTIQLLPRVLEAADPALDRLNDAFPSTRAFAREILPGVRETPATIDAAFPWIDQTRRLVSAPELQGLVADLRPAVDRLAAVTDDSLRLLPQLDLISRCALDVLLPTGDVKIDEGRLSTGIENYKEFFQTLVALSGESQNFDGNGQYTRLQPSGGEHLVRTGELIGGAMLGNAPRPPLGTRPAKPRTKPPQRRDVACHRNRRPDLNSARMGPGP